MQNMIRCVTYLLTEWMRRSCRSIRIWTCVTLWNRTWKKRSATGATTACPTVNTSSLFAHSTVSVSLPLSLHVLLHCSVSMIVASLLLGPYYGAIAVPSVTRCRCRRRRRCCCCCGHRRAAARSVEWAQHFSNASCLRSWHFSSFSRKILTLS